MYTQIIKQIQLQKHNRKKIFLLFYAKFFEKHDKIVFGSERDSIKVVGGAGNIVFIKIQNIIKQNYYKH